MGPVFGKHPPQGNVALLNPAHGFKAPLDRIKPCYSDIGDRAKPIHA